MTTQDSLRHQLYGGIRWGGQRNLFSQFAHVWDWTWEIFEGALVFKSVKLKSLATKGCVNVHIYDLQLWWWQNTWVVFGSSDFPGDRLNLSIIWYWIWFLFLYILFDVQVGEVGELSEIFQWKGEVDKGLPNWEESDKEHLAEELSDVLLYLIRLSDICGIDLGDAATKKIVKNAIKYPPKACWNTSLIWVCWSLFG